MTDPPFTFVRQYIFNGHVLDGTYKHVEELVSRRHEIICFKESIELKEKDPREEKLRDYRSILYEAAEINSKLTRQWNPQRLKRCRNIQEAWDIYEDITRIYNESVTDFMSIHRDANIGEILKPLYIGVPLETSKTKSAAKITTTHT